MDININTADTQNLQISSTEKIAGINLPNFNDFFMLSQKKTNTSDSEYEKAIIAQAKKDFTEGKFQTDSQEYKKLRKAYVQEVSPDRKNIIKEGLKKIENTALDFSTGDNLVLTLLGKTLYNRDSNHSIKYAEFKTNNGECVATYSQNNGWTINHTKAESERLINFDKIYNKAYGEIKRSSQNEYSEDEATIVELSSDLD